MVYSLPIEAQQGATIFELQSGAMGRKHKRGPKQGGVVLKEALQRMNYLYQVSIP